MFNSNMILKKITFTDNIPRTFAMKIVIFFVYFIKEIVCLYKKEMKISEESIYMKSNTRFETPILHQAWEKEIDRNT